MRTTDRVSEANEWVLVLAAAGIPHRLDRDDAGWAIVVPDPEVRRAERALRAYDAENRVPTAPAPPAPAPGRAAWTVGLLAGALLLGFFALTGPPAPGSRWFDRGAAAAGPMLEGQPWRAVTALTLHVDTLHALSNAIATALLLPPIVERLGPGAGVALVLLAGAAANLVAAEAQSPDHVAAGASTATFAAIGILAGLRIRTPHAPGRSRRGWVVLGAALLLLAMLGTGPGSDVLGHAAGLASGVVVGLAATLFPRPLSRRIQRGLLAALALLVAACWHLALAR